MITRRSLVSLVPPGVAASMTTGGAAAATTPAETAAIAEEAFIYGFPMVMNYGVGFEYFINRASPQYKAPFNQIYNTARVYTPQDTTIVTPNSDTPYSFVGMDLRAEPFVVCNPEIEKGRYFSFQFVDWYTANFAYAGTRTTGNGHGCFMVVGPGWNGEMPPGTTKMFRCETDFASVIIRTQLFSPGDIGNVKRIQARYRAEPLSKFLNKLAPSSAPEINWPKIDKHMAERDPFTDSDGQKPDCATKRYTLTFPVGQLPPVNAFWSVTMYDGRTQLLVANPINRFLINSPMLSQLKKNADGSITLYLQRDSPGADKESNWLPAAAGPIYVVMRLYWPKEAALKGSWKPPAVHLA